MLSVHWKIHLFSDSPVSSSKTGVRQEYVRRKTGGAQEIPFHVTNLQGVQEKVKKSIHFVWYKNKVKFLFLAHQLRGNMCPFCLITLTKPLCLLFQSKISMQKILRNAKKPHFWPILLNWLYQKDYWRRF